MNRRAFHHLYPFLIALLLAFSLFSCNKQTSAAENKKAPGEVEALKQEVMRVHDETMPRIGTLMNLKKRLKDELAQTDTTDGGNKEKALLLAIKQLEEADEAMMQWMRTYDEPDQTVGKAKALEYLELKKEEIYMVKEKMEASETAARAML
jgi:hypothetical protein